MDMHIISLLYYSMNIAILSLSCQGLRQRVLFEGPHSGGPRAGPGLHGGAAALRRWRRLPPALAAGALW